ncbi:Citrate carrier protein [Mycoavidus cysteinexigens]|uniref:Citrate carrier protein n=1 Tax=Mycoavidus cysteinexigens TaxID=1553431 RepID=A0A2Z6EXL6_9BURK|nr:2-hydroxycarboxylate transporter family protein [Mycoavidus cysteinexigens]BBE10181.1 Citrate carrier protein [Mycoavidus cysteinexigens]GAM53465.1 malate Na(+) symporter [bacterium endosymbiont of Mortierella elongata FMR23-6]GLR00598.1 citrate/malate transporter [Mycoavidus cysteinexigens]
MDASSIRDKSFCLRWQAIWWQLMDKSIGIVPLPIYCIIVACLGALLAWHKIPNDISVMIAILTAFGFTCAELGARIPVLRQIGGPVIVTTFLPSCLVYYQLLPNQLVSSINDFWQTTNILYLFIASVVVGSILGMHRLTILRGFAKIFIPLAVGSVAAAIVGTLTGMALGLGAHHTFFYIVIPIMAGGIGEGAVPLSLGYADIMNLPQKQLFAQILPAVMLGNLTAIICAGLLNQLGKHYTHLTGNGRLHTDDDGLLLKTDNAAAAPVESIAAAGLISITLYILGILAHKLIGLPAPVSMLFLAVLAKLTYAVSPKLEDGARTVYRFFSTAVTYPLLFAIGITITPWNDLLAAFHLANIVTIVATVLTLTTVGFFVGRWVGLYPIEGAIINACHSGMGGIGDLAILTSSNRLQLMPFAQIATRLGGALTITVAIILLGSI